MSVPWMVVRRVGFAVLSVYLVLSVAFGFVAFTADPNLGALKYQTALANVPAPAEEIKEKVEENQAAYRQARNLDNPIHERYVNWLVDISTFDWGEAPSMSRPVTTLVGTHLPYTLAYVIPAMVVSILVGIGSGLYSAAHRGDLRDRATLVLGYVGLGIPNFWLAEGILLAYSANLSWLRDAITTSTDLLTVDAAVAYALPTAILASSLIAGQLHFTRSKSVEVLGTDQIKLVRAKGAGFRRIARHVLRDLAVPLLALFLTELLGVLLISVFVIEHVFNIPGFGTLTFEAIQNRDLPLVMGTTMVVALVGIVGNLCQDLAHVFLDPRVADDE